MSLSQSQTTGSRAAPRDPRDQSGRRPASVFHDRRQYRLAEDDGDDEALPPRKGGALSSKERNFRTKAIHRSFAGASTARASARSQVDDIVSGESDDNVRERVHQELDADRIARLREMNKQRLEALEQKLLELHRQKNEQSDGGGASDGEARPAYFRHTKAYKPKSYTESQGETSEGDDAGIATDSERRSRPTSAVRGTSADRGMTSGEESEGPRGGYDTDPGAGQAKETRAADLGGKGAGVTGGPGPRVQISASTQDVSMLMRAPATKAKRPRHTTKQPFSFDSRVPKPTLAKMKFDKYMQKIRADEENEVNFQFTANPVPKHVHEPLFERNMEKRKKMSEKIRRESKKALEESQRPFNFWIKQEEEERAELQKLKQRISQLKEELGHFGVSERGVAKFTRLAWDNTQTDFTEAEQEELKLLKLKVQSRRKLSELERRRMQELQAEHRKKMESKAFNDELHRRLDEELHKQKTKFRSVPVPKTLKEDNYSEKNRIRSERQYKKEQRASWLRSISKLPPRMQKDEEEFGNKIPPTVEEVRRSRKQPLGDAVTDEHTFVPQAPRTVPNFQAKHESLGLELAERKVRMMAEAKKGELQPFYLRSEWNPVWGDSLKHLQRWQKEYEAAKVPARVPDFKLKKLGLAVGSVQEKRASQWELVVALATRNAGGQDGEAVDRKNAGLMTAEVREYCITPPSHHAMNRAIVDDIKHLKEERWPHTVGGRQEVKRVPVPLGLSASEARPGMTKAQMHRIQHTAKWKEEFERRKVEEAEKAEKKKKEREERWGMKDKVKNALAGEIEAKRQKDQQRDEERKERQKAFINDQWWEGEKTKILNKVKDESQLLMQRAIAKRLKAQAKDLFRNHLKTHGLEDMADELDNLGDKAATELATAVH